MNQNEACRGLNLHTSSQNQVKSTSPSFTFFLQMRILFSTVLLYICPLQIPAESIQMRIPRRHSSNTTSQVPNSSPNSFQRCITYKIYHSIRRISRAVTKSYLERYREKSRFQEILPNSFPKGLSLTTLRSSFFLQIFLCFYFDCVCPIQHLILFPRVTYFQKRFLAFCSVNDSFYCF